MKDQDIYAELSSIRNLMERSAKFISLSGLSGIMSGIYALIGAAIAYKMVYGENGGLEYRNYYANDPAIILNLFLVALAVLVLSISTGVWLTLRKAKKKGQKVWNPSSKKMLSQVAIPLFTGGLLILILIYRGSYGIIAPACLIFYGLGLIAGSQFTYTDVKSLGLFEIILGLLAALLPGYGIIFWATGFGLLHIVYGTIMHFKYDR